MPEAVFNFIALLGWNPGGEEEIFSREQLIDLLMKIASASRQLPLIRRKWIG